MIWIILGILIAIILIVSFIVEPTTLVFLLKITPKKFRLHKPKLQGKYYLQLKLLFRWYYIHKTVDEYGLYITSDKFSIRYPNHYIISKEQDIYNDRYDIIKFFSDTGSPEDNIKLD